MANLNQGFPIPTPPKPEEALEEYCKLHGFRRTINFTFECFVKLVNNLGTCVEGSGKGLTREKAHHEASKDLLFKLTSEEYLATQQQQSSLIVGSNAKNTFDIEVPGDPVSELQMKFNRNLSSTVPPVYEEIKVEGPPHKRVFTISCKFDGMLEYGSACTKKNAKRIAAYNILKLRQRHFEEKQRNEIQVGNFLSSIRSEIESSNSSTSKSKDKNHLDHDKDHDKKKKHKHKDKERDRDRDRDRDREKHRHRSNSTTNSDSDRLKNEAETQVQVRKAKVVQEPISRAPDPNPTISISSASASAKNESTPTNNLLNPTESLDNDNEIVKSDCELGEIVDSSPEEEEDLPTQYQTDRDRDRGKSLIFGGCLMGKKRKIKEKEKGKDPSKKKMK